MKIKTSELIGPALDWAVAKAMWGVVEVGTFGPLFGRGFKAPCINGRTSRFKPSTDWSQGGPIIEREEIATRCADDKSWWAERRVFGDGRQAYCTSFDRAVIQHGSTMLIAAMRCYVASRLGDEVDVPEELL